MRKHVLPPLTIFAAIWLPSLAAAQEGQLDFAKLAAGLNLTEEQVQNCIPADAVPGQRLSRAQRGTVMDCFKAANPALTNGDIRNAMMALRP
ncbi:hypothetical protein [Tateyamaria omphalii]|uniref:Uncharacterized protein n=1 Tax=Tateyamaria omphalii TaxID=299262 RepID=A0A1P8MS57_9RHOB|nr:hypothetical protein [Tateyamaria omphalii]APX10917.1 hypothetical protein BWR18_03835 [Tateyamaria omphalii]